MIKILLLFLLLSGIEYCNAQYLIYPKGGIKTEDIVQNCNCPSQLQIVFSPFNTKEDEKKMIALLQSQDSSSIMSFGSGRKNDIRPQQVEDSLTIIKGDSLAITKYTASLQKGNNFNNADVNWLLDIIKANVITDLYLSSNFKIMVDMNGVITGAIPTNNMAPADDKCIEDINKAIIGKKVTPFIAKNGKQYPSYSNLYISLLPSPIKQKGHAGSLLRSVHF